MNGKTTLTSKFGSYSAVAASFIASQQIAHAQVVYTDIQDTSGTQQHLSHEIDSYYYLDLNNDGVPDFELKSNYETYASRYTDLVQIVCLNSNEVAGRFYNASHFQSGDVINSMEDFKNGTPLVNG